MKLQRDETCVSWFAYKLLCPPLTTTCPFRKKFHAFLVLLLLSTTISQTCRCIGMFQVLESYLYPSLVGTADLCAWVLSEEVSEFLLYFLQFGGNDNFAVALIFIVRVIVFMIVLSRIKESILFYGGHNGISARC